MSKQPNSVICGMDRKEWVNFRTGVYRYAQIEHSYFGVPIIAHCTPPSSKASGKRMSSTEWLLFSIK
jgi:hypothetical protein